MALRLCLAEQARLVPSGGPFAAEPLKLLVAALAAVFLISDPAAVVLRGAQLFGATSRYAGLEWTFVRIKYHHINEDKKPENDKNAPWFADAPGADANLTYRLRSATSIVVHDPVVVPLEEQTGRTNFAGGAAQQWILVGGAERELVDPSLNEDVLKRSAQVSGGRYVPARDAGTRPQLLAALPLQGPERGRQDLWNTGWAFGAVVLLLGVEWTLRRRWGMQ